MRWLPHSLFSFLFSCLICLNVGSVITLLVKMYKECLICGKNIREDEDHLRLVLCLVGRKLEKQKKKRYPFSI